VARAARLTGASVVTVAREIGGGALLISPSQRPARCGICTISEWAAKSREYRDFAQRLDQRRGGLMSSRSDSSAGCTDAPSGRRRVARGSCRQDSSRRDDFELADVARIPFSLSEGDEVEMDSDGVTASRHH